jgi:hypothetical protein
LTAAGRALCAEAVTPCAAVAAQTSAALSNGATNFPALILFDITNPSLL